MATRRRSVITTRSSSSKTTKHKSERLNGQHQQLLTTTIATQQDQPSSSSTNISTPSNIPKQPCSPSPTKKVKQSCNVSCNNSSWSTPKAKRFRIPEIMYCPPAPKKQRTSTSSNTNGGVTNSYSNLRRASMSFFTPPELAEFFLQSL